MAILGHVGRTAEAAAALDELNSLLADPTPSAVRTTYEGWNVRGELLESLMEGLAKAGLHRPGPAAYLKPWRTYIVSIRRKYGRGPNET